MEYNQCTMYKKKRKILRDAKSSKLKPEQVYKLEMDNFQSHFSILAKNFQNFYHNSDTEAYFIRTMRPDLNCQKYFK